MGHGGLCYRGRAGPFGRTLLVLYFSFLSVSFFSVCSVAPPCYYVRRSRRYRFRFILLKWSMDLNLTPSKQVKMECKRYINMHSEKTSYEEEVEVSEYTTLKKRARTNEVNTMVVEKNKLRNLRSNMKSYKLRSSLKQERINMWHVICYQKMLKKPSC
ncbi:hypothetical protein V6N12_016627 [Hibiscus sabdariffa]|uniref:Uncharacterized protein n=1 Tax=Hibiscus sabdariffa TaxID=183260 RepID=A0ABR2CE67_9ROSI